MLSIRGRTALPSGPGCPAASDCFCSFSSLKHPKDKDFKEKKYENRLKTKLDKAFKEKDSLSQ